MVSGAPAIPYADDDEAGQEEFEAQLGKIADQLAELADADEVPVGYNLNYDPFDPADVDFSSGDWLLRVAQVQAWLRIEQELRVSGGESDPQAAAIALFTGLGVETPSTCIAQNGGAVTLTLDGADVLANRLDSAVAFQADYLEAREESSRKQATDRWIEQWEEEEQVESGTSEPIKARTNLWPIQEFSDKARKQRLNLSPTYQRGDVWPTGYSQKLIESVLRGIPLPSIILLRPQAEGAGGAYEVVDGKQRLTAILRFIGRHPDALRRVDEADQLLPDVGFMDLFLDDYKKFRRLWKTHMSETLTASREAEYYFPFKLASSKRAAGLQGELEPLAGKYYYEIRDEVVKIGPTGETVRDLFEAVSDYKVPLIEYLEATPRQIHEVFNLYNRQGKHLTAEEIRNALYHELKLMRLLLAAAGDNEDAKKLAAYVPESERWKFREMGSILTDYRFGTTRYKRTKLLSWLTSLVMHPAIQDDGSLSIRSTRKQIDEMFVAVESAVKEGRDNPLDSQEHLLRLVDDLHAALEAHSACSGWADVFKDDRDGKKWQELQLVASLVAVFLVGLVDEDVPTLLEKHHDKLLEFTSEHRRPEKTQNKTQWGFIGKVSLGLLKLLEVDQEALEVALAERYSVNCLSTLAAAARHYRPRQD